MPSIKQWKKDMAFYFAILFLDFGGVLFAKKNVSVMQNKIHIFAYVYNIISVQMNRNCCTVRISE